MKMKTTALVLSLGLAVFGASAEAKGCLKGAAAGGVAGHVAGHHGLIGAAGGCLVGRHLSNKHEQEKAQQQQQQAAQNANAGAATH
jgi:hypothetical protein